MHNNNSILVQICTILLQPICITKFFKKKFKMAGMNAYFRLRVIDNALQSNRKYSWKQLARICENSGVVRTPPSERTIRADIKILRDQLNAPIPKRCPDSLWYYTDKTFSLSDNPLFVRDLEILKQVKNVLEQFPQFTFSESLKDIIRKLENNFLISPTMSPKVIHFEKTRTIFDTDNLKQIYDAILNKKALQLLYHPFTLEQPEEIIIHPYFLKQYNSRWFLVAWDVNKAILKHFGLERIISIKQLAQSFSLHNSFEPDTYFNHVIGVSIPYDGKIETVHLQISKQRAPYIKTKPLHASQKQIAQTKDGGIIIELQLIPNFELRALILSHGAAIKVLKPKSLLDDIQKEIKQMHLLYTDI